MLNAFRAALSAQSVIATNRAFRTAAAAPSPRFWVSEPRAAAIVGKMLAGDDPTPVMNPEKRDMYREIFLRFKQMRRRQPDRSIADVVFDVVNAPAPRSYISWQRARSIIYKEMARLRKERLSMARLRRERKGED